MTAETLREAAADIREEYSREDVDDLDVAVFYLAVADWLNSNADHADATGGHCVCDDAALAVATAYRGDQS